MRILITGAAGFIGANFVRYCNQHSPDWILRGLDDLSTGDQANLDGARIDLAIGSLEDASLVTDVTRNVDAIVHLGALGSVPRSVANPVASHVANLTGTLNVMEAARVSGAFVAFASSSSVYGANSKLPKSEFDWTRPMSPYAATKLGAESYVLAYQFTYGLPTVAFRLFNVYGPLQASGHVYAAVIPRFLEAALKGERLFIDGDGEQSRDFTFVETVCATLHQSVSQRTGLSDPVNLAFGTGTTINELVRQIRFAVSRPIVVEHRDPRPGDVRASLSDGVRMGQLFPDVHPVSLAEGLQNTVSWFRASKGSSGC